MITVFTRHFDIDCLHETDIMFFFFLILPHVRINNLILVWAAQSFVNWPRLYCALLSNEIYADTVISSTLRMHYAATFLFLYSSVQMSIISPDTVQNDGISRRVSGVDGAMSERHYNIQGRCWWSVGVGTSDMFAIRVKILLICRRYNRNPKRVMDR
jgi:hypothetical protein